MISSHVLLVLSTICGVATISDSRSHTYDGCVGWISSPNFPIRLVGETYANYTIEVPDQHTLRLKLVKLDAEPTANCSQGGLSIYDGDNSRAPLITSVCRYDNEQVSTFWSISRKVFIQFKTNDTNHGRSFLINYVAIPYTGAHIPCPLQMPPSDGCDGGLKVLSGESGIVSTPDFPKPYLNNVKCVYEIDVSEFGRPIELHWISFDIEDHENCTKDSVKIYDPSNNEVHGPYCGSALPADMTVDTAVLYVIFESDLNNTREGFMSSFIAAANHVTRPRSTAQPITTTHVPVITTQQGNTTATPCPQVTAAGQEAAALASEDLPVFHVPVSGQSELSDIKEGYIVSPCFPGKYPNGVNGSIEITTSSTTEKKAFIFTAKFLDLEVGGGDDCITMSFDEGNMTREFCQRFTTELQPLVVNAKVTTVGFKSDHNHTLIGFLLHFRIADLPVYRVPVSGQRNIVDIREGYIASPGYPGRYPYTRDSSLNITASTVTRRTWYTFYAEYMDTEERDDPRTLEPVGCYDYITISDDTGSFKREYCGRDTSALKSLTLVAKYVTINFTSDGSMDEAGFLIRFHILDPRLPYNFRPGIPTVTPCVPAPSSYARCANTTDGQFALLHSHPWQVALTNSSGHFMCGGAVISPNWVVTSAYCVSQGDMAGVIVQFGARPFGGAMGRRSIARIAIHPNYDWISLDYNIALLRLEQSLVFNETVSALYVPAFWNVTGFNASIAKWNSDDEYHERTVYRIRETQVRILPHEDCPYWRFVTDRQLCAVPSSYDACWSDLGGPLVVRGPYNRYSIAGIFSAGMRCRSLDNVGVFTNITDVRDWMAEYVIW